MAIGPGKYDKACTVARESTGGIGAVLIVIGGDNGGGFSCQVPPAMMFELPAILETLAAQIRADIRQ